MFWKKVAEYAFLWILGGSIYFAFELIFRGFSHWSMFILGGICMMFFAFQGSASNFSEPLWKQVFRCTIFVISCEFITGIIVNKWLGIDVWDYSDMPLHLFGQICLPFALLFAILCTLGILLSGSLLYKVFREEKPSYRIL